MKLAAVRPRLPVCLKSALCRNDGDLLRRRGGPGSAPTPIQVARRHA